MLDRAILQFLRDNHLFKGISYDALQALANNMTLIHINSGQYLMHQHDPGSCMYLLYQGRLRVYDVKHKNHPVAEIGVGAVVGELAILTGMPRVADVRAVRDSTVIQIDQATFKAWLLLHPESAIKMVSESIRRLFPPEAGKTEHAMSTIALIPAESGMDIATITDKLCAAISVYKRCLVLSADDDIVHRAMRHHEPVSLSYLNECETAYDFIIYVATEEANVWTQQCIRQADKIVMIAPEKDGQPTEAIRFLREDAGILAETFLLLLHDVQKRLPHHTGERLAAMQADHVFHLQHDVDYQRIGRYFTGHSVSLVLSGGGLRGAAHIGLQYALAEKNIPIDMVGGSSFGGLAAAAIGMRLPREISQQTSDWVQKALPGLMDYTLPIVSLLRGEHLYELLTHVFTTDLRLEDLWLPTFCTATNMTDAELHVFDRGKVWECVRASISLPGIFPPVIKEGKVFVDGATFNNLPIDIMRERNNGGKVIASSVSTELSHEKYFSQGSSVSGLDILLDKFRAEPHHHLPKLLELLLNAEFVGAQKHMHQIKHLSDFYLDLNVSEFGMLDLVHWNAIIDKGYERGLHVIETLGLSRETLGVR